MADKIKRERPPFTILEDAILSDQRIRKHGLLVYWVLCKHADNQAHCFPSIRKIAKEGRMSASTVCAAIEELITNGYIEKQTRSIPGKKEKTSNLYTILYRCSHSDTPCSVDDTPCSPGGKELDPIELDSINKSNVHSKNGFTEYPNSFQTFWAAYPRKEGKKAAFRCWKSKLKQQVQEDTLIQASKNFAKAMAGQDKQFIKLASTFLGPDEHWADFCDDIPEAYKNPDPDQAERDRLMQKAEKTMNSFKKEGVA